MKPLERIRSGASRARRGTTRTARWAGGGVARGPRRAAWAIRDRAESAWRRSGGAGAVERVRSNTRVAIAWSAGALLVVAWIAWAIYTTSEHGGAAGLGVLISWPAAIAALALVAAPFVGLWLLLKRLRPDGGRPPIAGGAPDPDGDSEATGDTDPG